MPVEIVQFCWKYNLDRLQKLPEVGSKDALAPCCVDDTRLVARLH